MPKGPDMGQLMKQVQQMQADMAKAQEELKNETVEASAGGGMVKVKMSGDLVLQEITISPEAIDPEDPELLQDMVTAAQLLQPQGQQQGRRGAGPPHGGGGDATRHHVRPHLHGGHGRRPAGPRPRRHTGHVAPH